MSHNPDSTLMFGSRYL